MVLVHVRRILGAAATETLDFGQTISFQANLNVERWPELGFLNDRRLIADADYANAVGSICCQ